ncbi:MAG: hypothetical protein R8K47_08905 [Mariprofundaceae bacterium]
MGYDAGLPEWSRLRERDKRKHLVAGAVIAGVGGVGIFALASFVDHPITPIGAGAVGMVAAMLAGMGKEAADAAGNALDPAEGHGVELSDAWATWLGGALGAAAAVLVSAMLARLM